MISKTPHGLLDIISIDSTLNIVGNFVYIGSPSFMIDEFIETSQPQDYGYVSIVSVELDRTDFISQQPKVLRS